jgi:hypothetical protein
MMMKKQIRQCGTAMFYLAAALCAAGTELRTGPQVEYFNYREPDVMNEQGLLTGLFASYGTDISAQTDWRVQASYVIGNLSYHADHATELDLNGATPNRILDVRGEAGGRFFVKQTAFHLYAGAAGRLLVDDLPDFSGLKGYTREQTYVYLPAGVDVTLASTTTHTLTARVEYDWLIEGRNKSAGMDMTQDSGYGCQASLTLSREKYFLCFRRLDFEPFFQYWSIDKSDNKSGFFFEPANSSTLFGIRLAGCF